MSRGGSILMIKVLEERAENLRDVLGLKPGTKLLKSEAEQFEPSNEAIEQLGHFNIEWHIIASQEAMPLDDAYMARFYPMAARDFATAREHGLSYREEITRG